MSFQIFVVQCFLRTYVHMYLFVCLIQTLAEAELYCKQAMEEDWEREKEKILNSLLGGGSTDLTDLPTEPEVEWSGSLTDYML